MVPCRRQQPRCALFSSCHRGSALAMAEVSVPSASVSFSGPPSISWSGSAETTQDSSVSVFPLQPRPAVRVGRNTTGNLLGGSGERSMAMDMRDFKRVLTLVPTERRGRGYFRGVGAHFTSSAKRRNARPPRRKEKEKNDPHARFWKRRTCSRSPERTQKGKGLGRG